jgi:hypothetical protein
VGQQVELAELFGIWHLGAGAKEYMYVDDESPLSFSLLDESCKHL